jgi:hypothetical protein
MSDSFTDGLLEALQDVMFVLDTPGAMVRSAVGGGNPLAAAVDQDARIYGRDLLRQWGMIGPEDTWGNLAGGIGVEMALDPLNAVLGLGSAARARHVAKIAKANKATQAANKAKTAAHADILAHGKAMPPEVAAATKLVDEAGAPIRQYHGTPHAFEDSFDLSRSSPDNLYGPGAYFTENPAVASGYAEDVGLVKPGAVQPTIPTDEARELLLERTINQYDDELIGSDAFRQLTLELDYPTPEWGRVRNMAKRAGVKTDDVLPEGGGFVRQHFVDVRNPLDMREVIPDEQLLRLEKAMDAAGLPGPSAEMAGLDEALGLPSLPGRAGNARLSSGMTGEEAFQAMRDEWDITHGGGLLEAGRADMPGNAAASQMVRDAGYDSITHQGGQIVGDVAHNVTIALDPSQVYLPYVAENPVLAPLKPRPRRLPILPGMLGYNAAVAAGRSP